MARSAAVDLVQATLNLEADRDAHQHMYKMLTRSTTRRDRLFYLKQLATARKCIASDWRMIRLAAHELSHTDDSACCTPPF